MKYKAIYYRPTYVSYMETGWSKAIIISMYSVGHHGYVTLSLKHNVMMSQVCYKNCHVYQCHDLSGYLHLPLVVSISLWSLTCCAFTIPSIKLRTEACTVFSVSSHFPVSSHYVKGDVKDTRRCFQTDNSLHTELRETTCFSWSHGLVLNKDPLTQWAVCMRVTILSVW